jgi:AraC-like DNA-binding protein
LNYREQRPAAGLDRFVDCFWFLSADDGAGEPPVERLLPIGAVEVVLHHGSAFRQWNGAGTSRTLARGVVAGQLTEPLFIQPAGRVATMGLRFHPGGAFPFLGARLDAFTNQIASFEEVWGGEGRRFEGRLLECASDAARVAIAEEFLLSRLSAFGRQDEPVEEAARQIRHRRGRLSVSVLGQAMGLSARQMERRFAAALGIGPKSLCRVVRFQSVLRSLGRGRRPDWAGLAQDHGYADQSHLINEFRRLSGVSPVRLAAGRMPGAAPEPGFTLDGDSGLRVCPAASAPAALFS